MRKNENKDLKTLQIKFMSYKSYSRYAFLLDGIKLEMLLRKCWLWRKYLNCRKAGSNCLIVENVNGNIIDPNNEETYIEIMKKAFSSSKEITLPLTLRENKMKESFKVCFEKLFAQIR